ncbi:hypothetical protein Celaphus_00016772, partial [Cervus elaphus hippelaphus]
CIRQALKEKITILVTHQLQYLEDASQILILKDGKMVERGTYSEFLKSGVDIFSLFEKGNEQSESSPVPGTPTVISESLVQCLQSPRPSKDAVPEDQDTENRVLLTFNNSGLTVSTVLFGITRSLLIFYILVNSSQTLHNKMLETILRAPVLFFNTNP